MLVDRLRDEGIDAHGVEGFSVVTKVRSDLRIFVRAGELAAARTLLQRWGV